MENGPRLERNPEFRLESQGEGFAFVHPSGFRVETDILGKLVWEALPGRPSEIAERVRRVRQIPTDALRIFIEVIRRSGLAREEGAPSDAETAAVAEPGSARSDLVSVIVTTFNGADHIDACFRSIVRQSHPNVEIIAVDNASSDGTVERIRSAYPQVRIFALPRNIHYTGGVNYGAARAKGKYLFILNQDTELDPRCVERLVERAAGDEKIAAIAPMIRFFHLRGMVNGIGNEIWNRGWGTDNFIGHVDAGQFGRLDELPSACFGAVFIRKDVFEEVGPLDRGYGSFYEDVDWSFRCRFRGHKIVAAPRAVVYHKFGGSYLSRPKLKFVARNRQRLVLKLFQGKVRPGVFRRYLKEDIKTALSCARRGEWGIAGVYAGAYASLAAQIPGILAKRRGVMRRRAKGVRELDVFRLNPSFYECLTPRGNPRIDMNVLFGYYRWILKK